MKGNIKEFNEYLNAQVGQPYVLGGQHLKLTPDKYVSVINRKESDEANRDNAIAYCKAKFDAGETVLYAYDCSGLGMYWLQNVKRILPKDLSANSMMGLCTLVDKPKCGYWVFRMNGDKASHIGYMISDTEVVHAKGRAYGVCKETFRSSYWHCVGVPSCMEFDEPTPEPGPKPDPEPTPTPTPSGDYVEVKGNSVFVRAGSTSASRVLFTAHKGNTFPYLETAESGWYKISTYKGEGYISNKPHLTELHKDEPSPAPVPTQYVKVIGSSVRIRVANSADSKTIAIVHKGTKLRLLQVLDDWYQIKYSGITAYISSKPDLTKIS